MPAPLSAFLYTERIPRQNPIAYSPHGLPQFQECIGIKIFDPPPVAFQDSCGNPVVFEIIAWLQM
ncbi:MAG: hypothetical protein V5783_09665, partial [Pontiella sp.]